MNRPSLSSVWIALALLVQGCGEYPESIHSIWSIRTTSASKDAIVVDGLPLADWPRLGKFRRLRHFSIAAGYAAEVTDDHLLVLSRIRFPDVQQLSLAHAGKVTDESLAALASFPSLRGLQLTGTAVTDKGLAILASFPHLEGVDLQDCRLLTPAGFLALGQSTTIRDVSLSLGPLSQSEIESLIGKLPRISRWTIEDRDAKLDLDSPMLRSLASRNHVSVYVTGPDGITR